MNCKNCYHADVCAGSLVTTAEECKHFKDKEHIVELPCKVGNTVWFVNSILEEVCEALITRTEQNYHTQPNMEWIEIEYFSKLLARQVYHMRLDLCLNKTVFLTREEAEKALEELK